MSRDLPLGQGRELIAEGDPGCCADGSSTRHPTPSPCASVLFSGYSGIGGSYFWMECPMCAAASDHDLPWAMWVAERGEWTPFNVDCVDEFVAQLFAQFSAGYPTVTLPAVADAAALLRSGGDDDRRKWFASLVRAAVQPDRPAGVASAVVAPGPVRGEAGALIQGEPIPER